MTSPHLSGRFLVPTAAWPLDTAFTEDGFSFTLGDLVQAQAERCVNAYPFGTYWWLVRKIDLTAAGTIDFKTAPNEAGQVEIGYGLSPPSNIAVT